MPYRGRIGTTDGLLAAFISYPVHYHYDNARCYSMHTFTFKRKTAACATVSDVKILFFIFVILILFQEIGK